MSRWESLAIALVLAAAAVAPLAGCGGGEDGSAGGDAPIDYVRTGGLAGVAERLKIDPDGRATLQTGGDAGPPQRFTVTAQKADGVRRALDDAGFADLPTDERTIPEPDGFNYAIRYRGHLVRREQAGLDPRLERATRRLDAIVAAHRS